MPLANLDGLIAAMGASTARVRPFYKVAPANELSTECYTFWYMEGIPGAGTVPSSGMAGATCSGKTTAGALRTWTASGGNKLYATSFSSSLNSGTSVAGALLVVDRLWEQSGISVTTTTAQTVNSVTLPARDDAGGTTGLGVYAALEVSTATTNGSAITGITISYTNTDGTAGRTGRLDNFPATAVAGTKCLFALEDGDQGIQSIQSITLGTTLASGVVHLTLVRPLFMAHTLVQTVGGSNHGPFQLLIPELDDDVCVEIMNFPNVAALTQLLGYMTFAEG